MAEGSSGWKKGCFIALVVLGVACLACLGGVVFLGWGAWSSPSVQLGVRAAGAAMELNREALVAPGAADLRAAGCAQAMVYAPARMQRFVQELELDGGLVVAPETTLLVCASRGEPPTCDALAAAYATAVESAPEEVLVDVWVQAEPAPRCEGAHGRDGARLRDQTDAERRFAAVVRPRVF